MVKVVIKNGYKIAENVEKLLCVLSEVSNLKMICLFEFHFIASFQVLEAITTKKCLEPFHLESFETLGDSFLKYAASQQLFKTHQDQHEGILSSRREKIISNDSLCKLGCNSKIPVTSILYPLLKILMI